PGRPPGFFDGVAVAPEADEHVLRDVGGVVAAAGEAEGEAVDPVAVRGERGGVEGHGVGDSAARRDGPPKGYSVRRTAPTCIASTCGRSWKKPAAVPHALPLISARRPSRMCIRERPGPRLGLSRRSVCRRPRPGRTPGRCRLLAGRRKRPDLVGRRPYLDRPGGGALRRAPAGGAAGRLAPGHHLLPRRPVL